MKPTAPTTLPNRGRPTRPDIARPHWLGLLRAATRAMVLITIVLIAAPLFGGYESTPEVLDGSKQELASHAPEIWIAPGISLLITVIFSWITWRHSRPTRG